MPVYERNGNRDVHLWARGDRRHRRSMDLRRGLPRGSCHGRRVRGRHRWRGWVCVRCGHLSLYGGDGHSEDVGVCRHAARVPGDGTPGWRSLYHGNRRRRWVPLQWSHLHLRRGEVGLCVNGADVPCDDAHRGRSLHRRNRRRGGVHVPEEYLSLRGSQRRRRGRVDLQLTATRT